MSSPDACSSLALHPFAAADLDAAHQLSLALAWPHRREDWAQLLRAGEGLALVDGERLVGTAFCLSQGRCASVGLVIVADDHQGRGLGRRLMQEALALAGSRTALLVATEAGAPLYRKLGFERVGDVHQHQGEALPQASAALGTNGLRRLEKADRHALEQLAEAGSGHCRAPVLGVALDAANAAVGIERDGRLVAFALRRPFGRGESIGPIYAENQDQAERLVDALLEDAAQRFMRLDAIDDAFDPDWLAARGLVRVDSPIRMVRGEAPSPSGATRQFGMITQAMG
ncbi:GNAT family N-acetyltransferase [Halotalea alkalilenta]|uniref:GNAT family N-acetyltransferase n=1 Tax=Halotalea alkalilenta TaxID=376489 RepID=UPI0006939EFC|nr:GNAT family N-acetyltransferase [Halotalea alkalilenta]